MRSLILLPILLAAAACDEPRKMTDKEASETVKRVNKGPSFQIEPEPILQSEIDRLRFRSAGCVFSPGAGGHGAMLLAMKEAGYMKVDRDLVRFAADSGSAEIRDGVRSRYFGTMYWFKLSFTDEEGGAHVVVGDHNDTIVFEAEGKAWCDTDGPSAEPSASPASGPA